MGADPLAQSSSEKVRAFFGLPVPEAQRATLAEFVAGCARAVPEFRWTPAANLHLTIRFVGEVDRSVVEAVAVRVAAASPNAFDIELGNLGTFRRGRLVRVVWLGLHSNVEPVAAVAALVETECVAAGLGAEKRKFQAHLTLARARPRDGALLPALPEPPRPAAWHAHELVLYSSRLGRGGSVYEPLRVVHLD